MERLEKYLSSPLNLRDQGNILLLLLDETTNLTQLLSPVSQVSLVSISLRPIMYQMQAIQCASSAKTDISKVSTMALYCE